MKKNLFVLLTLPIMLIAQNPPELLWTELYGGNYSDCIHSIIETSDGNLLMGGYYKPAETENYDLYLLKVDPNGQIIWEIIYPNGPSNTESERIKKIIPTQDGNYVALVRIFEWFPLNGSWLMKFDTDGNILWIQEYYGYCVSEDFVETDDGGFLITGRGDDNSLFDDCWMLRLDESGNIIWEFENDPAVTQLDWMQVYSIINHNTENSYLICGYADCNHFFAKIDDSGDFLWIADSLNYWADELIQIENEFAFCSGNPGELGIAKIDNSGNFIGITSNAVMDSLTIYNFEYSINNGYFISGSNYVFSGLNFQDLYLANFDDSGELTWQETYDISNSEVAYAMSLSDGDNVYLGGIAYTGNSAFLSKFELDNTSVENEIIPSDNFKMRNYPNPFNPETTIDFTIQIDSRIELSIYNIKGQKVKTLVQDEITRGTHSINWNGDDEKGNPISSGIYYYKLNVNGKTEAVHKCLLLK
jgi:hypothetical protein